VVRSSRSGRKGFTLIELLVVIAIIGILAAMLFPVFARARESARKTQCLANVKNIAMGYQIYLTDYDRFPPTEHRQEVIDYFDFGCSVELRLAAANPYLKTPVILDEYIKSREVWRCPSARSAQTYPILNPYLNSKGTDDWFLTWQEDQSLCPRPKGCNDQFPPGWGGPVTDSRQGHVWCTAPVGSGAFEPSIGGVFSRDLSLSAIDDSAKRVVCGDAGMAWGLDMSDTIHTAYPDMCRLRSVACSADCGGDWEGCSQSRSCSPPRNDPEKYKWMTDVQTRKNHVPTRHMGGSNLGFADGHAKWMSAEEILWGGSPKAPEGTAIGMGYGNGILEGLMTCSDPNKDY
jgi:prepilin-type N-terminal cleavage/methylation domain-containing protein/prepilin-type processing-associated H-X9-DG protein